MPPDNQIPPPVAQSRFRAAFHRLTVAIPGIGLCLLITLVSLGIQNAEERALAHPYVEALVIAILLGMAVRTFWRPSERWLVGIAFSAKQLLEIAVTLLGASISFAAIAASGDVNVNAIAPGIAAALVATVAGLGVAIPALFGYNYLISRIKDLTNDIQVFVDEFVTKLAEFYDAERPDPVDHRMAAE